MSPVWSPDGRYIVFQGKGGMFLTRSDGAGKPQALQTQMPQSKNKQVPNSFTPDGKRLAWSQQGSGRYDLWTMPLQGDGAGLRGGKPEAFLQTAFDERHPLFSPDGRWLAYASNESRSYQVYVRAFPDKRGQVANLQRRRLFPGLVGGCPRSRARVVLPLGR